MVKLIRKSCNQVDDNIEEELKLETWHQHGEGMGGNNIRVVGSSEHNATMIHQGKGNQMKPAKCGSYALVIRGDYPVERTVLGCAIVEWLQ